MISSRVFLVFKSLNDLSTFPSMSSISRCVTQQELTARTFQTQDLSSKNEDFEVLAFELLGRESYVGFLDARQLNFCQVL